MAMPSISPYASPPAASGGQPGFWRRQFGTQKTETQIMFDWAFGVMLPIMCLLADPIVFKGAFGSDIGVLAAFRPFAYLLAAASIPAMIAWLVFGARVKWVGGFLAGLFLASGAVSLILGIVLVPLSIIGTFFVVGLLGFTPLVSAVIYARNGVRAARLAGPFLLREVRVFVIVFAAAFAIGVPAIVNRSIIAMLETVSNGDAVAVLHEIPRLRRYRFLYDSYSLVRIHRQTSDVTKKGALEEAFRTVFDAEIAAGKR